MEIDLADRMKHVELERLVASGAESPRVIVMESLFDMEGRDDGENPGGRELKRGTDGVAPRACICRQFGRSSRSRPDRPRTNRSASSNIWRNWSVGNAKSVA